MIRRLVIILFLFVALDAFAQEPATISPIVSFDYGKMLFINRSADVLYQLPGTANGNSNSESFGIGAEFSMPGIITGQIGLMGRIEGIYSIGNFDFNGYSVSGINRKLLLEVSALWDVQPFAIRVGPWISQAISRSIYENDPNGTRIASGDSIASAATHFGISAGLSWQIPNFPIRPEINSHLDLKEIGDVGANAFSFGLSLSYSFDGGVARASARSPTIDAEHRTEVTATPVVPSRVRFLVDRSEIMRDVPLERVEMRVKQYAMVDSANTSPRVSQWLLESYHLPQIGVLCEVDRDALGELTMMKDGQTLAEFWVPKAGSGALTFDTTFNLEDASVWQEALSKLDINRSNRVIAQLHTLDSNGSQTISDTLILPPVDTNRVVRTIVKKQFRFLLSDKYLDFEGGRESLDLLLGRIKVLLDSNVSITIIEPVHPSHSTGYSELQRQLSGTLGEAWVGSRHEESFENPDAIAILMEY